MDQRHILRSLVIVRSKSARSNPVATSATVAMAAGVTFGEGATVPAKKRAGFVIIFIFSFLFLSFLSFFGLPAPPDVGSIGLMQVGAAALTGGRPISPPQSRAREIRACSCQSVRDTVRDSPILGQGPTHRGLAAWLFLALRVSKSTPCVGHFLSYAPASSVLEASHYSTGL